MPSTLDLHGAHIHEAWKKVAKFIETCYYTNYKVVKLFVGKVGLKTSNTYGVQEYRS